MAGPPAADAEDEAELIVQAPGGQSASLLGRAFARVKPFTRPHPGLAWFLEAQAAPPLPFGRSASIPDAAASPDIAPPPGLGFASPARPSPPQQLRGHHSRARSDASSWSGMSSGAPPPPPPGMAD